MVMVSLVILEGILSYKKDKMFFTRQMRERYIEGRPFVGHAAMWSDALFIIPLTTTIVAFYSDQWSRHDLAKWFLIVWVVNTFLHWLWSRNKVPDCLAWGGRLTYAGWPHYFFQGIGLNVIVLFYLATGHIDPKFLIAVSVLLAIHLPFGTHLVFSYFGPDCWPKDALRDPFQWGVCIGGWIALFVRCCGI